MIVSKMLARASVSMLALAVVSPAFAQSTGSQDFDQQIVVTGSKTRAIQGVQLPDTPKTRQVLTQDWIKNQREGQTIDDIINYIPGVSFQNNDPYGNAGGTLNIHGFDSTRISQTFDGIPLNDTGNYAIYSQEQLDSELIDQVNVSLGSTDIDSPTASASGSTVNYTTITPSEDFHVRLSGSMGEYQYDRIFGMVETGNLTPFGTRALVSASQAENEDPYYRHNKARHWQYNFKVYQPIGSNGDFIALAGNYNKERNNNFPDPALRLDQLPPNGFPTGKADRSSPYVACTVAAAVAGVTDKVNSCGTDYGSSNNPSDNGNIRINSRFTLAPNLVLTVDPSFQFVKANGGLSSVTGYEGLTSGGLYGYIGGHPYLGGVDANGDGTIDATNANPNGDAVTLYAPSLTRTHRVVVLSSLRWDIAPTQTVRVTYAYDHGRHRQTGEVGYLNQYGNAVTVYPDEGPTVVSVNGKPVEKRNRLSYAILNQVSGEYRGQFFDNRLTINAGVRAPFFERDLNNYCVTESGGKGYVDCFNNDASQAAFLAANPTYVAPMSRTIHYHKVLPSAGFIFSLMDHVSLYGSYDKGIQVPGTDNLYNAFSFSADNPLSKPKPETTDNFNGGVRYKSGKIQAELSGWYTIFHNRLASSYDPIQNITIYRNLGTVHKYGVDGSFSYQPVKQLSLYAFGSYLKSKILDNVQTGVTNGVPVYALTAGKRESGAPVYLFGGRVQGNFGPLQVGIQAKRTGPRYLNDQNLPVTTTAGAQIYGAKTPAYTLVDLDARFSLKSIGMNDRTWVSINVTNLFDKLYVGGFSGNTSTTATTYTYIGTPRTVSGTINFGF
jgi:iron complex outermembrane recepter protein